jgi:dephospho-CoA kinase
LMLVSVTGMPGSGKSIVASRIAQILNCPIYSMGDIVRREVQRRGLALTSSNIEKTAVELRKEIGPGAVAILLKHELEKSNSNCAIIDGMRSLDEARLLAKLGPLCIIAVHASPMTRFNRIISRSRRGDASNWQEFIERDLNNLKLGIGNLIALADFMIVNESTLSELEARASKVAEVIRSEQGKGCSGGRY